MPGTAASDSSYHNGQQMAHAEPAPNIECLDLLAPLPFHGCRAAGQELHKADPAEDDLLYKCGDPEELAELEGDEDEE